MATVNVLKLKKQAVELGADKAWAVKAGRDELEEFIASAGKKSSKKTATKKSGSKPAKKASKKTAAAKAEKPASPAKKSEGKSKVSKSKKTAKNSGASSKKAPAAQSTKKSGKAKRPSTPKADKDAGRVLIGSIDWSVEHENWQPRANSPVMRLYKALKKTKGNIDKSYDLLKGDMWEFVGKTKRDGTKRTKAEGEAMLRYRLNRTKFEFATRTGQHTKGGNRVKYGTGDHATANKKAASKAKRDAKKVEKTPAKKATAKKGAKKSSKKK